MSIQIGKLLPDGRVRHIKALHETLSHDLTRKLRLFYPNDKRVDALLSLGDILVLGPSPYGRWTGHGDAVHCHSRIRDNREAPQQFSARLADNTDIFSRMADSCLLFNNGKWYVVNGNELKELPASVGDVPSHDSMRQISVYVNKQARLENIKTPEYWQELEELAERESRILYVYRDRRLVRIVQSSNLKKKLYATQ
uniref:Uncharacterized protein n=1 Tax=virus sp. ct5rm7 TaxID=2827298 RepID=A0A8S5RGI1_9VIRU|nr:MAG TPA: hypothetical protein [virus sp. ct5rm7]